MEEFLKSIITNETIAMIAIKIIKIIIIIFLAKILRKVLTSKKSFIFKWAFKGNNKIKDEKIREYIAKGIRALIYIVEVIMIIEELGFDLSILKTLVTGLGLSGVVLTLAAQDTAQNLFAGIVIYLDKPFKIGDYIEIEEHAGTVEEISFRSTKLRTAENALLHIPNSEIADSTIINKNEMKKRRYKTDLTLELDTPLEKVQELIEDIVYILKSDEKVFDDEINVKFQNITDNGLEVVVIAYINIVDYTAFLAEQQKINFNIMKLLENKNINLAYNTQTIYMKNA